ncbi:hypothetical protein Hanom_Chr00s000001g01597711 [Helianthus anomalus]
MISYYSEVQTYLTSTCQIKVVSTFHFGKLHKFMISYYSVVETYLTSKVKRYSFLILIGQ